ncbi:MAG: cation diffusion facilitator family transporter [Actinomycetota bacterium]
MSGNHAHGPNHPSRADQRRVLWLSLGANGALLVVELVGGLVLGSLALLADAAHMASDVMALSIALVAQRLLDRPASTRHSYGFQRAEVIGASINAVVLLVLAGWIVLTAFGRAGGDVDIHGGGVVVVALLGLVVNLGSAVALKRFAGRSLNMRGAYLHMLLDAVGSVAALGAGVAIVVADAVWVDAAVSIGIAVLVAYSALRLLAATVHVLLEGTPAGLDPALIAETIREHPQVEDVHHLHVWSLASDTPALSAHVVLEGDITLHEAQGHGDRIREVLRDRFGIDHCTLELECHTCEPEGAPAEGPAYS